MGTHITAGALLNAMIAFSEATEWLSEELQDRFAAMAG